MSVLLLRLAGPLQAWGSAARFVRRTTENAPTKSGVLGLLAAAEGRPREDDLSDLVALRFGVRIDQPGTRVRDFQTAHHFDTDKSMPLSERFYLADAVFVAAVEGEPEVVHRLHAAVQEPVYLPYLGRRSCPPAAPIDLGVDDDADLATALERAPWQASLWHRARTDYNEGLTLLLDASPGESPDLSRRDEPISFDPRHRRYHLRGVVSKIVPRPGRVPEAGREPDPDRQPPADAPLDQPLDQPLDHDPTSVLGAL